MLSERVCRLLTAYVDGELSPAEEQAVQRLLQESAEARTLYEQLRRDADLLRRLPPRRPPRDFPQQVLRTITDRKLHPAKHSGLWRSGPTIPAWVGLGTAAAVLLVVGLSSYFYFASSRPEDKSLSAVGLGHKTASSPEAPPNSTPPPFRTATAAASSQPSVPTPLEKLPRAATAKEVHTSKATPPTSPSAPSAKPGPPEPSILTGEIGPEDFPIPKVETGTILSLPLRDLDQEKTRQRLQDKLDSNSAFRLELFCLDHVHALEHLQRVLGSRGLHLLVDPSLKNQRVKTNLLVYAENVKPQAWASALEQLGSDDRKAEARKRSEGQFGKLVILPMTEADQKKLVPVLGFDPTHFPPPRPNTPLGVDIHQPLAQETAGQITKSLAGQGTSRSAPGKPTHPSPEHLALVL
ncbi:MAG: zf-HC2 domain-containing protein, partial [Planctomycetes bacterium]|nr:zf-HC2 domain-containing protein [Planctomycetota bacterium]